MTEATRTPRHLAPLLKSDRMDWGTPPPVFAWWHARYRFSIDLAASADNALCDRFFSVADNALEQSWAGETGWCNPPYGRGIGDWVQKAATSHDATTVMLIPARCDTRWFHDWVWPFAAAVWFYRGRLKFVGAPNSAPFPSMIAVYRNPPPLPHNDGPVFARLHPPIAAKRARVAS